MGVDNDLPYGEKRYVIDTAGAAEGRVQRPIRPQAQKHTRHAF
jgi:hypothetical protein